MKEICDLCSEKPPKYVLRFTLKNGKYQEKDVCPDCRISLDNYSVEFTEVDHV